MNYFNLFFFNLKNKIALNVFVVILMEHMVYQIVVTWFVMEILQTCVEDIGPIPFIRQDVIRVSIFILVNKILHF